MILGIAAVLASMLYLLYRQGFAVTKCIAAVLFVFRMKRKGSRASLNTCTGWVRYRGRFRESRIYEFHFDCRLSGGDAEVILLDGQKQELIRLNRQQYTGDIKLDGKAQYYLQWEFHSATGKCGLHWQ